MKPLRRDEIEYRTASRVWRERVVLDERDQRDPGKVGAALLALRARAPKAPLSKLYDRHKAKLEAL